MVLQAVASQLGLRAVPVFLNAWDANEKVRSSGKDLRHL